MRLLYPINTLFYVESVDVFPVRLCHVAVISDKYTFLRGKCKSFPRKIVSCGCWREHCIYLSIYLSIYLYIYIIISTLSI